MVKDPSDSKKGNPLPQVHGYSFQVAARVLLYAPSHRHISTYHGICYTSCGGLAKSFKTNIVIVLWNYTSELLVEKPDVLKAIYNLSYKSLKFEM